MTTTTIRTCDFCGARGTPRDLPRWGLLVLGEIQGNAVTGESRDICPVCIARLRSAA